MTNLPKLRFISYFLIFNALAFNMKIDDLKIEFKFEKMNRLI